MAKYGFNSFSLTYGGTDMSAYITSINGVDIESIMEDSHAAGDAWFEALSAGIRKMSDIVVGGFYDDTATTGPDAKWSTTVSSPATAAVSTVLTWGGSKTTTVTTHPVKYTRKASRNELTKFEATLRPTGAVTEA